jgi:hypothetical protein
MATTLFLDIDGVINPYVTVKRMLNQPPFEKGLHKKLAKEKHDEDICTLLDDDDVNRVWHSFDPSACARIKELCTKFQAQLVITSSWAQFYDLKQLKALFALYDLKEEVADSIVSSKPRHQSILEYVDTYHIDVYLVIDDANMKDIFDDKQILSYDTFSEQNLLEACAYLEAHQ